MKPLHISKFSILIMSIVVLAVVTYAIVAYTSSPAKSNQDERIYLHSTSYQNPPPEGYVRVQDMKPDSSGVFMYPSSYGYDSANAYQEFLLIRLPAWLGGDKNDISSYRAYSMLDLDSHCMVKYKLGGGMPRIEDPCHFEDYRTIDGASYYFGIKSMSKPLENALPQLDLAVDSDGYISVKPPTWTADKNGLIGDGRHLSKEQILKSSKEMLSDYAKADKSNVPIPLELDDKTFLIDVIPGTDGTQFYYTSESAVETNPRIDVIFCNCTGTAKDLRLYGHVDKYLQAWKDGDVVIYTSPLGTGPESMNSYEFQFFKKGYQVVFYPHVEFGRGMQMMLDNLFNGVKLTELEQVPVGKGLS